MYSNIHSRLPGYFSFVLSTLIQSEWGHVFLFFSSWILFAVRRTFQNRRRTQRTSSIDLSLVFNLWCSPLISVQFLINWKVKCWCSKHELIRIYIWEYTQNFPPRGWEFTHCSLQNSCWKHCMDIYLYSISSLHDLNPNPLTVGDAVRAWYFKTLQLFNCDGRLVSLEVHFGGRFLRCT